MLRLRPYKPCDAETILSWIKDEAALRRWSSDRYGPWPVTARDMNEKYLEHNGDCPEPDNFYPMTAYDETGVVGHLILRWTDEGKTVLRLGFIIVDDAKRGRGCGREMVRLAMRYAFGFLQARKLTLGVFENNPAAYRCYRAAGFREIPDLPPTGYAVMGERWKCIEMEMLRA